MAAALVLTYGDKRVVLGSGPEVAPYASSLEAVARAAEDRLALPQGTFDLHDRFGRIRTVEDLQRAIRTAGAADCTVEVREHRHYTQLRELQEQALALDSRCTSIHALVRDLDVSVDRKLAEVSNEAASLASALEARVEQKLMEEFMPLIHALTTDKEALQAQVNSLDAKLDGVDVKDLKAIIANAQKESEEVRQAILRVNRFDTSWVEDRVALSGDLAKARQEVFDLQAYLLGKLDVCIEADAELRRHQQMASEHMSILMDDFRRLSEEQQKVTKSCEGALAFGEETRAIVQKVNSSNETLKGDCSNSFRRLSCLESAAADHWEQFVPAVLYAGRWHSAAKGNDVQLSGDRSVATGRGFAAATGVRLGFEEGLAVGDGPCHRFVGAAGKVWSYFEAAVEEVSTSRESSAAGGLYVGMALQSGEEIWAHPRHEFDGWLVGGIGTAIACRASSGGAQEDPSAFDFTFAGAARKLPATLAPGGEDAAVEGAAAAAELLRIVLPPLRKGKGDVKEVVGQGWKSQSLQAGDRLTVLFACHKDGGACLRVAVNGSIAATQEFVDGPPSGAVGFFTPVVWLAGTGKAARFMPSRHPPPTSLAA